MKHNNLCRLVLEDSMGRVIRSYRWDQPKIHWVRRKDTGRVEAHADLISLKEQDIPFTVIKTSVTSSILKTGVRIPNLGLVKKIDDDDELNYSPSVIVEKEDDTVIQRIFNWTTLAHVGLILAFFISYWIQSSYFQEEEIVVKVQPQTQQIIKPQPKKKVVKASDKKINRKKKVGKKKKKKVVQKKRKSKSFKNVGALAALGGLKSGKSGGTGLKLKSALKNSGNGDSAGIKSLGKDRSALAGKGLFARSGGGGKVNRGTVGYGTRGRAGGQAGYGSMNIGGNAGGYDYPIQEEGTVDGGLEKSQIEAVIRRNIGQIIYCYEKGLQTKPSLSGRVAMHFVINGQGRVRTTQVKQSSLKSSSVHSCMQGKIKNWAFPKPHGNVDVKVTYPFVLRRANKR